MVKFIFHGKVAEYHLSRRPAVDLFHFQTIYKLPTSSTLHLKLIDRWTGGAKFEIGKEFKKDGDSALKVMLNTDSVLHGWHTIIIPLEHVRSAPENRQMDMQRIQGVGIFFSPIATIENHFHR